MKYKIFVILILGILSFSQALALDSQGDIGKQYENFTIVQGCNGATFITLSTIQYPDSSIDVVGQNMTSLGNGVFSYNFTNTDQLGRYDVIGISDGCEQTFAFYFEISSSEIILYLCERLSHQVINTLPVMKNTLNQKR